MKKSEGVLNGVGIAMKNMQGDIRPVSDILNDLAAKWNTLSDAQQQHTAYQLAGQYQLNSFLSLMQNWNIATAATDSALNSQGSAMKENEKYMGSLGARVQSMKTAWDTFALAMGKAFVSDSIVVFTGAIANLANNFAELVNKFGALPVILGLAGAAFVGTKVTMMAFNMTLGAMQTSLLNFGRKIGTTVAGLFTMEGALKATRIAAVGLASTLGAGLAFFAVGKILEWITGKFSDAKQSVEDFDSAQSKLAETNKNLETLKQLGKEYTALSDKQNKSAEEKSRLVSVEQQLSAQYGLSTTTIDGQTASVAENTKAINDRIASLETEAKLERDRLAKEYDDNSTGIDAKIKNGAIDVAQLRKDSAEAQKIVDDFLAKVEEGKKFSFNYDLGGGTQSIALDPKVEADRDNLNRFLQELGVQASKRKDAFDKANSEYEVNIKKKSESLKATMSNYFDTMVADGKEVTSEMRIYGSSLADAAATANVSALDFKLSLEKYGDGISKIDTKDVYKIGEALGALIGPNVALGDDKIQKLTTSLSQMGAVTADAKFDPAIQEINNLGLAADETALSLETVNGKTSTFAEMFNNYADDVKTLNNVLYQMRQGQKLTAEQVGDLVAKYPQLANAAKEAAGGWTLEKDAVELLRDSKIDLFNSDIDNEEKRTIAVVNGAIEKINKGYGLEIKAIEALADSKLVLAQIDERINTVKMSEYAANTLSMAGNMKNAINAMAEAAGIPTGTTGELQKLRDLISDNADRYNEMAGAAKVANSTLKDTTYGTSEQADAQKKAEDAAKKNEKEQNKLNETYTETIEILTDTQQKLKDLQAQQDKMERSRKRMREDSQAMIRSYEDENKKIQEQIDLLKNASAEDLISQKVTKTTKGNSADGSPGVQDGSKLESLLSNAITLANDPKEWKYANVNGKYKGTFEEFVAGVTADCSQFIQEMFKEFLDIDLPRDTQSQVKKGSEVTSKANLQPGDLVFFNTNRTNGHVGVYIGDQKFVHMGNSGLKVADMNSSYWAPKYNTARHISDAGLSTSSPSSTVPTSNKVTGSYSTEINKYAEKYNVEAALIKAIATQESH